VVVRSAPVGHVRPAAIEGRNKKAPAGDAGFGRVLHAELGRARGLRFSRHARQRLEANGIALDRQDMAFLEEAVGKAAAKGARESLVLLDGLALVVSVENRTVITAVDSRRMGGGVFTNIDSAVIGAMSKEGPDL